MKIGDPQPAAVGWQRCGSREGHTPDDARTAIEFGAEGIGLFRTEQKGGTENGTEN